MTKEKILKATHEGKIELGETELTVAVLSDGTRLINYTAIFKAFGKTKRGAQGGSSRVPNMPPFLNANNLQPYVGKDLMQVLKKVTYIDLGGKEKQGFKANILPLLCKVYLDARANKVLKSQQEDLARASEILLVGLSNIGITALIDEATGYQYERERFELQKILSAYISDEIVKWQLTFTDDFYKEVYRLWGLPFIPKYIKNKPSFIGKLTTKYIYEEMPSGILEKIKEKTPKTPKGHWKYKFHQSLTPEVGREHLKKQIIEVTTLMSIAKSKEQFQDLFKQKYNKIVQLEMEFNEGNAKPKEG
jgi:hypothetical protein